MKVGDDNQSRRAERDRKEERREKRNEKSQRRQKRNFSELLRRRDGAKSRSATEQRLRRHRADARNGRTNRDGRCADRPGSRERDASKGRRATSRRCEEHPRRDRPRSDRRTGDCCRDPERETRQNRDDAPAAPSTSGTARDSDHKIGRVGERTGRAPGSSRSDGPGGASPAIEKISRRILEAARVGRDGTARRVLFLDVSIPGRGDVRIRLRRDDGEFDVRLRAGNDELARSLRRSTDQLKKRGEQRDVEFNSIRVVQ